MDLKTISNILTNILSIELLSLIPISELKFPYESKNGYDQNVPFLFVQKNHFTEIWNIGVYTDYQHTWETGMVHFSYTIQELMKGNKLKIIEIKNHRKEISINSLNEFMNEWILENPNYKHIIDKIYEYNS